MLSIKKHDLVIKSRLQYYSLFGSTFYNKACIPNIERYFESGLDQGNDILSIPIVYDQRSNGRLQASSGSCIQYFPRNVRNWLLAPGAVDLDIVNAAPTILAQVAARHDIQCDYLTDLAANPKKYLDQFKSTTTSSNMKGIILFSDPSTNVVQDEAINAWLIPMQKELKALYEATVHLQEYKDAKMSADQAVAESRDRDSKATQKNKRIKLSEDSTPRKSYNHQGKFLARLYFAWETKVMKVMLDAGSEERLFDTSKASLVYDGLIIFPDKKVPIADIIHQLESAVSLELALDIQLRQKDILTTITQDIDKPPSDMIADSDDHGARLMAFLLRGQIKQAGVNNYIARGVNGLWFGSGGWTAKNPVLGHVRNQLALSKIQALKKKPEEDGIETSIISCGAKTQDNILKCFGPKVPIDNDFMKDIVLQSMCKLRFKNGYYQFQDTVDPVTGYYGRFYRDQNMDSMVETPGDFPLFVQENVDFIRDNFLGPIFDGTKPGIMETFLCDVARAIAGHTDKATIMLTGPRNCGKSVIGQFLNTILGPYYATLPASVLSFRPTSGDGLTDMKWVVTVEHARLGVVSEGRETAIDSGVAFSGETMKQVQSLKEGIVARQIYCDPRRYYSLATIMLMMNEVPKMDIEAVKNVRIYVLDSKFVTEQEKDKKSFMKSWKIKNEMVDKWSFSPEFKHYQDAFFHILLQAYRPKQAPALPSMIAAIEDIIEEDPMTAAIAEKLEITGEHDDYVAMSTVKTIIKSMYPGVTNKMAEFNQTLYTMVITERERKKLVASIPAFESKSQYANATRTIDNNKHKVYFGLNLKEQGNLWG